MSSQSDYLQSLGISALGSRVRRLFERLNGPVSRLYREEIGFEQRWFSLTLLLADRGPLAIGEAAEALGSSHVAILQVGKAMETAGLLTRTRSPDDGRSTLLALTRAGKTKVAEIKLISARVDVAAARLLEEAAPDFLKALNGIERALDRREFQLRLFETDPEDTGSNTC